MHLNVPVKQPEATLSPPTSAFSVLPEMLQTCLPPQGETARSSSSRKPFFSKHWGTQISGRKQRY